MNRFMPSLAPENPWAIFSTNRSSVIRQRPGFVGCVLPAWLFWEYYRTCRGIAQRLDYPGDEHERQTVPDGYLWLVRHEGLHTRRPAAAGHDTLQEVRAPDHDAHAAAAI